MDTRLFHQDPNLAKTVAKMFDKSEEMLNEDASTIQEWMKTQRHLPEVMDTARIRNFLFLNKCSIEKTKQKIDMYYTIRSVIPDFYSGSNPKLAKFKNFMNTTYLCVHPKLVEGLYRLFFVKVKAPNTFLPKEMILQFTNVAEVRLKEDLMVGDVLVFDFAFIAFNDLKKLTPSLLAKAFAIYEKVYSLRIKKMYFVHSPPYISALVSVLKSLLKPKIFSRVEVHTDAEVLKTFLTKEELPKDYGGHGPSLEKLNGLMVKLLSKHQDRFEQLDNLRVNEGLRAEKFDDDDVLGFHGNFGKLNVD